MYIYIILEGFKVYIYNKVTHCIMICFLHYSKRKLQLGWELMIC